MSFQNDRMPLRALALLEAARDYDDPMPADRERISAAMAPKLAVFGIVPVLFLSAPLAAAPAVTGAAATASASGLGLGAKLALVLVSASVAAGGTMYALQAREQASAPVHASAVAASSAHTGAQPVARNAPAMQPLPSATETPAITAPTAEAIATSAPVIDRRPARPSSHSTRARFAAPRRAARARTIAASEAPMAPPAAVLASSEPIDASLREELALIARANTALRLEHAADALRALDEHARLFKNGVLSDERRGLRVLALCQLSPNQAALDARDAFLRTAPHTLLAPKVRAACAKDPNERRP